MNPIKLVTLLLFLTIGCNQEKENLFEIDLSLLIDQKVEEVLKKLGRKNYNESTPMVEPPFILGSWEYRYQDSIRIEIFFEGINVRDIYLNSEETEVEKIDRIVYKKFKISEKKVKGIVIRKWYTNLRNSAFKEE